jgi:N-acetylglucosaminyl-diphospho-decaprenol L-rhamnosyltransferase
VSLAIVTVAHGSRDHLARLLDSLARELSEPPQVVVVDTGPDDGGAELAAARGAEVIRAVENPGFGAANNLGLARVGAEVTALLNPDVELLDAGLAGLTERAAGRDALLVPRLLNPDGSWQDSAHPVPGRLAALLPALVPARALPRPLREAAAPWRADAPRRAGWAIAAAVVARTATLRRLGPFDPEQFLFYEDLDLCLRAAAAGVPTELRPEVALRHRGGHSTGAAYGGEPLGLLARRRRDVVRANLGRRALAFDDAAQGLTFAVRALAKGPRGGRERAQLGALLRARRG